MSNSIIERELTQGAVPIGTPKAYQYDAALVETAKAVVEEGLDIATNGLAPKVLHNSVYKLDAPLDEFGAVDNGTQGQYLRTKGDGNTEWADIGVPTDEQVETVMTQWLDDHPEATTTVEDGSLTRAKFGSVLDLGTAVVHQTKQQMIADTSLKVGYTVMTKGYWSVGDGGGALYNIRAKTSADVHTITVGGTDVDVVGDDGSVIAIGDSFDPDNVSLVAELVSDGTVNVKQFGAKGDGTTDDSTAIQNAVNYIGSKSFYIHGRLENIRNYSYSRRASLVFPLGCYVVKNITIANDDIHLIGDGATIVPKDSSSKGFVFGLSIETIKGFYFWNFTDYAIYFDTPNRDTSQVQFEDCRFLCCENAVYYQNQSSISSFKNCYWYYCKNVFTKDKGDKTYFDGCWFSQYQHEVDYETDFTLNWGENTFTNCFFIPSGKYKSDIPIPDHVAWFTMTGTARLSIDHCRGSSEPGFKGLINYNGSTTIDSPNLCSIRLTNNEVLVFTYIVNVMSPLMMFVCENNSFSVVGTKMLVLDDSFDVAAWNTYISSREALRTIRYVISGNNSRTGTDSLYTDELYTFPALLYPFIYSDRDNGIAFEDDGNSGGVISYFLEYTYVMSFGRDFHLEVDIMQRGDSTVYAFYHAVKRVDFAMNSAAGTPAGAFLHVTDIAEVNPYGTAPTIGITFGNDLNNITPINTSAKIELKITTDFMPTDGNYNTNRVRIRRVWN